MGGKQIYKGNKNLIHIACFLIIFILGTGCQSSTKLNPKSLLFKNKAIVHFSIAEESIKQKDFDMALEQNNKGFDVLKYEALFQKGFIYAHPDCPFKNYKKSHNYFQVVVNNNTNLPDKIYNQGLVLNSLLDRIVNFDRKYVKLQSKHKNIATELNKKNKLVETLNTEIEKLKSQIEHMKEVDLKIEEKKRESLPES